MNYSEWLELTGRKRVVVPHKSAPSHVVCVYNKVMSRPNRQGDIWRCSCGKERVFNFA